MLHAFFLCLFPFEFFNYYGNWVFLLFALIFFCFSLFFTSFVLFCVAKGVMHPGAEAIHEISILRSGTSTEDERIYLAWIAFLWFWVPRQHAFGGIALLELSLVELSLKFFFWGNERKWVLCGVKAKCHVLAFRDILKLRYAVGSDTWGARDFIATLLVSRMRSLRTWLEI